MWTIQFSRNARQMQPFSESGRLTEAVHHDPFPLETYLRANMEEGAGRRRICALRSFKKIQAVRQPKPKQTRPKSRTAYVRNGLKPARTPSANNSGCSHAAKWPPLSGRL
jgi:hypothetical protein